MQDLDLMGMETSLSEPLVVTIHLLNRQPTAMTMIPAAPREGVSAAARQSGAARPRCGPRLLIQQQYRQGLAC